MTRSGTHLSSSHNLDYQNAPKAHSLTVSTEAHDILTVTNLNKSYPGFSLQDVSFSVPPGSVVGLVGSNGAGKTTTIKSILGLIEADGGSINILGARIFPTDSPSSVQSTMKLVGTAFDAVGFPSDITIKNIRLLMSIAHDRFDKAEFDRYCERFNLESNKKVKALSRGMGMKLSLAVAFSISPRLLILDEPTAGLDPMSREELLEILAGFVSSSTGILMSSHITSDLEKIGGHIVCIDKGRMVFSEPKHHILHETKLAYCQKEELDSIRENCSKIRGDLHYSDCGSNFAVLISDPVEFANKFPGIRTEPMTIDDYMSLMIRGERL